MKRTLKEHTVLPPTGRVKGNGIYIKPEEIYDNWQSMSEIIAYDEQRYNQQGI